MKVATYRHEIFNDVIDVNVYKRAGCYYGEAVASPGITSEVGPTRCKRQAYEETLQRAIAEYPLHLSRYYNDNDFILTTPKKESVKND